MRHETITLTPSIAKHYLDNLYEGQRALRKADAEKIARDIRGGRYANEMHFFEPLAVTPEGKLMNGQHRCLAVILANMPIKTDIVYDVPEELFQHFDGGKARAVAQFIDGKNAAVVAGVAKFANALYSNMSLKSALEGYVGNASGKHVLASRTEILDFASRHEDTLGFCATQATKLRRALKGGAVVAMGNALYTILYTYAPFDSKKCIEDFVNEVADIVTTNRALAFGKDMATRRLINSKENKVRTRPEWWFELILAMYEAMGTKKIKLTSRDLEKAFEKYNNRVEALRR